MPWIFAWRTPCAPNARGRRSPLFAIENLSEILFSREEKAVQYRYAELRSSFGEGVLEPSALVKRKRRDR